MSIDELIHNIYLQARDLGACDKITGNETLPELIDLFLSPQGGEFCMEHHFPSTATLREFKRYGVGQYGVYIDVGEITIYDPTTVAFIGRTTAKVYCHSMNLHRVLLYRGASASITAEGWTVTRVHSERGCRLITDVRDHAIIT